MGSNPTATAIHKGAVLREAFRVLRPRGRFAVSDIVLLREIPEEARGVVRLWTGCISGALRDSEYVDKLTAAGFRDAGVEATGSTPAKTSERWPR